MCDSDRQAEYKKRVLTDPERAAKFRKTQIAYTEKWKDRPENKEKQAKYRRDWYERNKHGESIKAAKAAYVKRHPDRLKEAQRKYRAKVKADPEKYQAFLEGRRIWYHLRKERLGKPPATRHRHVGFKEKNVIVPAEPFRQWLIAAMNEREIKITKVARMAHMDPSWLERILSTNYTVMKLETADRVLTALDGPSLAVLYPDA